MNKILGRGLLILCVLITPIISWAATDITLKTDRNPVFMNESFQLIFEANGAVDSAPDFSPLSVLLDILSQSESSNISIINGTMKRSKTWTLMVMAKAPGQLQIPAIRFGNNRSKPVVINVARSNTAQATQSKSFFIKLKTDVKNTVQQAQLILTVRAFSDRSLGSIDFSQVKFNYDDVLIEKLGEQNSHQTTLGNTDYLVVEQKYAIIPQQAGTLIIDPIVAEATVSTGRRSFFGNLQGKIIRARSAPLKVQISEKPKDAKIWLPAKSVKISQQWSANPNQFKVGEPITRTITLIANGLIASQLPELSPPSQKDLKRYADQPNLKNQLNDDGVVGMRQEKLVYIPTQEGALVLPAIKIPWWNVRENRWQQATLAERHIMVQPGEVQAAPQPIISQPAVVGTKQLEESKTQPQAINFNAVLNSDSWWKWVSLALFLIWVMTLFLWLKTKSKPQAKIVKKEIKPSFNISELKVACQKKDAEAAKLALLNWANAYFYPQQFSQLSKLSAYLSAEGYQLVSELEAVLYSGHNNADWNADELFELISSFKNNADKTDKNQQKTLQKLHLS